MDSTEIERKQEPIPNPREQAEIAAKYGLAKWIFRRGQDFVKGRVLEIGEGEGYVAKYCKREGIEVDVLPVNLKDESFEKVYTDLLTAFDLVYILINGTQIVNNLEVVANSACLLKEDGYLIIVLPCQTALYGGLGQGLEDWKMHNRRYVKAILDAHYELVKYRFFEVMDDLPLLASPESKYEERVQIFKKTIVNDFVSKGLFVLIVGQKKIIKKV